MAEIVAGVDWCKRGWFAVFRKPAAPEECTYQLFSSFSEILDLEPGPCVIAVDMPIGLPDVSGPKGRCAERAVRPLLGPRQSSVFSMPSRSAVQKTDYHEACEEALRTSEPPRKVARQGFALFPMIREIDALMTRELEARVYEVHPELGFWRLNGGVAMSLAKKIRNEGSMPGITQRQALLERHGFPASFWKDRPSGVGADDLVDAAVNAVIAERIWKGDAQAFPPDFERDANGFRMAIWA